MSERDAYTRKQQQAECEQTADEQRVVDGHLKSRVIKRSLVVGGHKTSVSLEDAFWTELRAIAQKLDVHLSQLVGSIDSERQHNNLSSAIRLFVFEYSSNTNAGHQPSANIQAVLAGAKRQGSVHRTPDRVF